MSGLRITPCWGASNITGCRTKRRVPAIAVNDTNNDPKNNGRMPYQSCQKLAVIQSRPKANA